MLKSLYTELVELEQIINKIKFSFNLAPLPNFNILKVTQKNQLDATITIY